MNDAASSRSTQISSTVQLSGRDDVDTLLYGTRWGSGSGVTEITYSFTDYGSRWVRPYGDFDEPSSGFAPLSDPQVDAVREALDLWAAVANVRFVEVSESQGEVGDLRFGRTAASQSAHAYLPGGDAPAGDVWLASWLPTGGDWEPGDYGFFVLVHEIGHTLGLDHPHGQGGIGGQLAGGEDWLGNSVMSYRSFPGDPVSRPYTNDLFPTTPMKLDILAVQHIYGANPATNGGNTTYAWSPGERIFETIYDTGGIDTIDWSNQSSKALIDLRAGSYSELGQPIRAHGGKMAETVAIVDGTLIENAVGGSGNDRLFGNELDNLLDGGPGKDRLFGLAGDDVLIAGGGKDRIDGGAGLDLALFAGDSADFRIKVSRSGKIKVIDRDKSDGDLGKNKLVDVEILEFDDVVLQHGPGKTLLAMDAGQAAGAPALDHLVHGGEDMPV